MKTIRVKKVTATGKIKTWTATKPTKNEVLTAWKITSNYTRIFNPRDNKNSYYIKAI